MHLFETDQNTDSPYFLLSYLEIGGPMAHILHAGGRWKLESPCRSQETGVNMAARQANKVPGGQWGPRVVGSRVSLTAWAPKQTNTSS